MIIVIILIFLLIVYGYGTFLLISRIKEINKTQKETQDLIDQINCEIMEGKYNKDYAEKYIIEINSINYKFNNITIDGKNILKYIFPKFIISKLKTIPMIKL